MNRNESATSRLWSENPCGRTIAVTGPNVVRMLDELQWNLQQIFPVLRGRTRLCRSPRLPFHFPTRRHCLNGSSHCSEKICSESNSFSLWLSGIKELSGRNMRRGASEMQPKRRPQQAEASGAARWLLQRDGCLEPSTQLLAIDPTRHQM